MAMNLGIGGPPRKRGLPPPPFGGSKPGGMAPASAAPAFASDGGADASGAADEEEPLPAPPSGPGADDGIPPESVCYRSEMETCGACTYNAGGQCDQLQIPVSDGDGCNLFKDREGGGDADDSAGQYDEPEPSEGVLREEAR